MERSVLSHNITNNYKKKDKNICFYKQVFERNYCQSVMTSACVETVSVDYEVSE